MTKSAVIVDQIFLDVEENYFSCHNQHNVLILNPNNGLSSSDDNYDGDGFESVRMKTRRAPPITLKYRRL